jgi:isocitrate/isopropylmalate dehydrogenase
LIAEGKARTADEIRELMSGNICRCGAYPNIVAAIEEVLRSGPRTPDLGGSADTTQVGAAIAALVSKG